MSKGKLPKLPDRMVSTIHSIRFRLVLWFTFILALILAAFSTFIFLNQLRDMRGESAYRLERKMATLEVNLTVSPSGLVVPPGVLQDTDIFLFTDSNGQVLASRSPLSEQDTIAFAARALQEYQGVRGFPGRAVIWRQGTGSPRTAYIFITLLLQRGILQNGLLTLGSPADPYRMVSRLLFNLIGGSLVTLLIALLGGYWLADRAMRPVHTITQAARSISETDLSRRLNMKSKDELGELANTFDAMLERLQVAFERQRQFVADASHELRTPLTIVNLETSRALSSLHKADDYRHALAIIQSENDFMTSLVNDLLTLARMDAGQAVMERLPVDLSDVVIETMERLTPLASRTGVRLEAGDLPEVHILGDRHYLVQMVSNLVDNGIKYAAGNQRNVFIETGREAGTVWVRVSDDGPGIAPEHLDHLFDRFYRIDQARTRRDDPAAGPNSPAGSGLGLSIVQWIAKSHGGEVKVESQVGAGTTFEVRFKASESDLP